jgi:hypothetical protein
MERLGSLRLTAAGMKRSSHGWNTDRTRIDFVRESESEGNIGALKNPPHSIPTPFLSVCNASAEFSNHETPETWRLIGPVDCADGSFGWSSGQAGGGH